MLYGDDTFLCPACQVTAITTKHETGITMGVYQCPECGWIGRDTDEDDPPQWTDKWDTLEERDMD